MKCNLKRTGTSTNNNRELIIYLYEKSTATSSGSLIDLKTVSFMSSDYTARRWFTGLDSSKYYYVRFFNNSDAKPSSSMDISGTSLIDDIYI